LSYLTHGSVPGRVSKGRPRPRCRDVPTGWSDSKPGGPARRASATGTRPADASRRKPHTSRTHGTLLICQRRANEGVALSKAGARCHQACCGAGPNCLQSGKRFFIGVSPCGSVLLYWWELQIDSLRQAWSTSYLCFEPTRAPRRRRKVSADARRMKVDAPAGPVVSGAQRAREVHQRAKPAIPGQTKQPTRRATGKAISAAHGILKKARRTQRWFKA